MNVLVLNPGSSSLKFKLIEMPSERLAVSGQVEKIGESESIAKLKPTHADARQETLPCPTHREAVAWMFQSLYRELGASSQIDAIGHRVVQGRDIFLAATVFTETVLRRLESIIDLAPLHMPASIDCLKACQEELAETPQILLFDTAYFRTMEPFAYRYPVPTDWYENHSVRRYGFHGISYQYVNSAAAEMLGRPLADLRLITAHLGNGVSMTALKNGSVVDTSMGFTPLEGLVMGTRSGHLDPSIIPYLMQRTGRSPREIVSDLNNHSGLAAVSGVGRDMRAILAARAEGNQNAKLAFQMFIHALKKYTGAYYFALGGADAFVFTGGIGENSPAVRSAVFDGLAELGFRVDPESNEAVVGGKTGVISDDRSRIRILVVPTDEELMIARETHRMTHGPSEENTK
jgi:acetate kinase